jgi:transposase
MTSDLLALADWLHTAGCTHVAMESTSVYWRPISNLLEGLLILLVVNAQHMKAVPGRTIDVTDAEWIAELLRHGLLRGSFIPSKPPRQLRALTRHRTTLGQDRARVINRLQAVMEDANIKRASVVTDIRGVSARARLEALIAGQRDTDALADLARGRWRTKRDQLAEALRGYGTSPHSVLLTAYLSQMDDLDEAVDRVRAAIDQHLVADQEAVALLDPIPGVSQRKAEIVLADLGTDRTRFPNAKHLASWAGMCPGHHDGGGKRLSGKTRQGHRWWRQVLVDVAHVASNTTQTYLAAQYRTRQGHRWWRQVLVDVAHVASNTTQTYLAAQYRRLAARRGKKRALIAVGHTILCLV